MGEETTSLFNACDYDGFNSLSSPYPESGERNSREFIVGLIISGLRVVRWTAKPFSEPNWPVLKRVMLWPEPVFWIDVF